MRDAVQTVDDEAAPGTTCCQLCAGNQGLAQPNQTEPSRRKSYWADVAQCVYTQYTAPANDLIWLSVIPRFH